MKKAALRAFYAKPRHDAAYFGRQKTEGFDLSREDRVGAAKYNLIQWQGVMGENVPYPTVLGGRDLSEDRNALVTKCCESRMASFTRLCMIK